MGDADEVLRTSGDGRVLIATMSRPAARNALNHAMVLAFRQLAHRLWDERPGACIITGIDPAFCAGGDLKERRAITTTQVRHLRRDIVGMFTELARQPVPLIAAVNGAARGGGFELALACDVIVAAEEVTFALPEVDLGIIPAGGGTQNLVRVGGLPLARRMILLGDALTAHEAMAIGLVRSVLPRDELDGAALEVAHLLASKPALAVRQAREAIAAAWGYDIGAALAYENDLYDPCIDDPQRTAALDRFAVRPKSSEQRA
jgi:enoyl-CoA hydratase/carnithine racemase